MNNLLPTIIALDFDGVICDGLVEYFATTKKAYQKIWQKEPQVNLEELASSFYQLRPVIETGWEMPVLLRALVRKIDHSEILQSWNLVKDSIVTEENLNKKIVANTLDSVRDDWISSDLTAWLELHRFYPGIVEVLNKIINSPSQLYIVTTKEGRFVHQLLQQQDILIPRERIIGKESKRPKYETLRLLRDGSKESEVNFWFVEDRLPALQLVKQQPDLNPIVKLFMADWGYNVERDRNIASDDPDITLISLAEFKEKF